MTTQFAVDYLQELLDKHDDGVLKTGQHSRDSREFCALELVSLARGLDFSDNPSVVGMPDIRPLNDGPWSSDIVRTQAMLPLVAALSDWSEWSCTRQAAFARLIAIDTVKYIVSELPALTPEITQQCRAVSDLSAAEAAAGAAEAAARYATKGAAARSAEAAGAAEAAAWAVGTAADAAWAARAARAAADAAWAARAARAADNILKLAVSRWLNAVTESAATESAKEV